MGVPRGTYVRPRVCLMKWKQISTFELLVGHIWWNSVSECHACCPAKNAATQKLHSRPKVCVGLYRRWQALCLNASRAIGCEEGHYTRKNLPQCRVSLQANRFGHYRSTQLGRRSGDTARLRVSCSRASS